MAAIKKHNGSTWENATVKKYDIDTGWYDASVKEKSVNLFDKDNAPDMQLYTGGNNTIMSAATAGSTYIVCKSNTSYTIKKKKSARFVVALTNEVPANGVSFHNGITNNEGTSIQITTDTTAKYIFIFYYAANYDTDTEATIRDTIFVYEGFDDKNYEPYWK